MQGVTKPMPPLSMGSLTSEATISDKFGSKALAQSAATYLVGVAAGDDALLDLAVCEGHLATVGHHGDVPLELGHRQIPAHTLGELSPSLSGCCTLSALHCPGVILLTNSHACTEGLRVSRHASQH